MSRADGESTRTTSTATILQRGTRVPSNVVVNSYPRPPALVIEVGGEIDVHDVDRLSDYLTGFVHGDHPLVVDFSTVNFLDVAGLRALLRFAAECRRADRAWVLVASDAVKLLLRVTPQYRLPVEGSLEKALMRLTAAPDAEWRLRCVTTSHAKRC